MFGLEGLVIWISVVRAGNCSFLRTMLALVVSFQVSPWHPRAGKFYTAGVSCHELRVSIGLCSRALRQSIFKKSCHLPVPGSRAFLAAFV